MERQNDHKSTRKLINRRAAAAALPPLREPPFDINEAEPNYGLRPCPLERRAILNLTGAILGALTFTEK
jgi:hypothetical protein